MKLQILSTCPCHHKLCVYCHLHTCWTILPFNIPHFLLIASKSKHHPVSYHVIFFVCTLASGMKPDPSCLKFYSFSIKSHFTVAVFAIPIMTRIWKICFVELWFLLCWLKKFLPLVCCYYRQGWSHSETISLNIPDLVAIKMNIFHC